MTVTAITAILSGYVGTGYVFLDRLNLVRARLINQGNWPDLIRVIEISVTTDAATGFSVVVLPSGYSTILAGAIKPTGATAGCWVSQPLSARNIFDYFNKNGLGYGSNPYDFQELGPDGTGSKRYKVPTCTDDDFTYIALVKVAYVALTAGTDEVTPNNIGAIKAGLQALNAEDSDNRGLSRDLWAEAMELLAEQSENETGAAASGNVEISDDFDMCRVGTGL